MAQTVLMQDGNGNWVPVTGKDMVGENCNRLLACRGKLKSGQICGCPMRYSIPKGIFYERTRAFPHADGCPCAKKRKESTVSYIDTRLVSLSFDELVARIDRPRRKTKIGPIGSPDDSFSPIVEPVEAEDKVIKHRRRAPHGLLETVHVLQSLGLDDYFTDRKVTDLILDERNISLYRSGGKEISEKPFIIIGKKTDPNSHGIKPDVENREWLLVDAYTHGKKDPFVFLIRTNHWGIARLNKYSKMDPVPKICVLAHFKRHQNLPNVYVSERIGARRICLLE